jgi:hypothetical protein
MHFNQVISFPVVPSYFLRKSRSKTAYRHAMLAQHSDAGVCAEPIVQVVMLFFTLPNVIGG